MTRSSDCVVNSNGTELPDAYAALLTPHITKADIHYEGQKR